jgi:putative oxidoreductase
MTKLLLTSFSKYQNFGLLLTRIIIGSSYIYVHGFKKVIGGPETWEGIGAAIKSIGINVYPVFWGFMASISEFFGGILLVFGLFFRPAAIFIFFTMVVATANHISNGDPMGRIAYPLEMAALMFLLIFVGPGKFSLDKYFFNKI